MWISPILQGVISEQLVGVKRTIGGRIREQLVGEQENNWWDKPIVPIFSFILFPI